MRARFVVYGEPQGKGRPKFSKVGDHVKTRTPDQTVIYENLIKTEYRSQCNGLQFPDQAQLDMRVMAFYQMPSSVSKKKRQQMLDQKIRPTKKPDADNILNQIAYRDVAQIVDTQVRKFYSDRPRIEVLIRVVDEQF